MKTRYIVGIDEVGRGALAGPVVVAAVAVATAANFRSSKLKVNLRDSKELTAKQREEWFRYIEAHPRISYALARVYPRAIERMNITKAANLAALRAYRKLTSRLRHSISNMRVYLDGGLYLGSGEQPSNARTIVRGDQKYKAIKFASIIAKVSRDQLMRGLAKRYPEYGFEIHKGYGTKLHRMALKKHGPSEAHRLTFLKKLIYNS